MILSTTHCNSNHHTAKSDLPAEAARIAAGFTLEEAARRLRLSPRTLRAIERRGDASLKTARRLARLYGCSGNLFLFPPRYFSGLRTTQASMPSVTGGGDTGSTPRAARRYSSPKTPTLSLVPRAEVGE
jgi:DNA-binding XRE family transcriptional regulator